MAVGFVRTGSVRVVSCYYEFGISGTNTMRIGTVYMRSGSSGVMRVGRITIV